jgi:hypothetical protein
MKITTDDIIKKEDAIELFSHIRLTDENFPVVELLYRELGEIIRPMKAMARRAPTGVSPCSIIICEF